MELNELVIDIFNRIIKRNSMNDRDSIPHSDLFVKDVISQIGIDEHVFSQVMDILKESHKILSFEIVREDEKKGVAQIEGYIDADLTAIRKLKNCFNTLLVDLYEKEYNAKLQPYAIIQEIFPKMNMLNNTPIGQIGNKAIMLNEYEKLIEKKYQEYTENWKEKKLSELLEDEKYVSVNEIEVTKDDTAELVKQTGKSEESRRAVDSEDYDEFDAKSKKYPVETILSIYGASFFYRIHLRKYNFSLICELVEKGKINKKSDLKILKEMLGKVKLNFKKDDELKNHKDDVYKLDRMVSRFMHIRH